MALRVVPSSAAWRWKGIVAAIVVGAWLCAACIAFGFDMPKALSGVGHRRPHRNHLSCDRLGVLGLLGWYPVRLRAAI